VDKLVITKSPPLSGSVTISGAKNAALPLLISSLLADSTCSFENVPALRDISTTLLLLKDFGASINQIDKNHVEIDASRLTSVTASYDLVSTMRASTFVSQVR
jgi:UDP-N-acetylglucosamine 1-carboxyvinyltransferase